MGDVVDLWVTQTRETVVALLLAAGDAASPTTAQKELFGDATTGLNMFVDGITRSGTTLDIGMFGKDDFYYFYMELQPTSSFILSGEEF